VNIDSTWVVAGGILAGLLQALGYVLYIKNKNIDPNPVTWFMFAYGTMLLIVLEWDSEAGVAELILPVVCSTMAVSVSVRCWIQARRRDPSRWWPKDWWPEDNQDKAAFCTDLILTACYILAWVLLVADVLSPQQKEGWVLVFLIGTNAATISSFFPLLHGAYVDPGKERSLPWIVWTSAYTILGIVRYVNQGTLWSELMIYPILNAPLHALVAWYARPSRQKARMAAV
jgi:hypothetical protein